MPITMYGCNKLYCEHLGRYFTHHFRQLGALSKAARLDFRSLRFPGLISAETVPTGGTSDFGPEMLHAAAQGKPYACFVGPEARIPFMAMPDAVARAHRLLEADRAKLSRIGLQHRRLQRVRGRDRRAREARLPGRADRVRARRRARADRRLVARGRGRHAARAATGAGSTAYDFDRAFDEYLLAQHPEASVARRTLSAGPRG